LRIKAYRCGAEYGRYKSEYPLGIGYLLSNCSAHWEVVRSPEELTDCDMIALSSHAAGLLEAVRILNGTDIPVVIGGQGTLWEGLRWYPFHHVVIGEGEDAMQQIINGTAEKTVKVPLRENIDSFLFPDRGKCGKSAPIITSRGCPWNCKFCSSQKYWQIVRYHSAEYVVEEIKYILQTYPRVRTLCVQDDLFIANRPRFDRLAELWFREGFEKRLKLQAFIRSNLFDEEMGRIMLKMGFRLVRFGAETASDRMLEILGKRTTMAQHQWTIDVCHELGLKCVVSFMRDLPGETEEDRQITRDFIKRNQHKCAIHKPYKFRAFPGTAFYNGENPLEESMRVR